jgi:hypothetical protein
MPHIRNTRLSSLAAGVKGAAFSPENRKLVIALAGVLAVVFIFVSANVAANHDPKPHDLPVGVVGPPRLVGATARQLDRRAPGAFQILGYRSPAAARTAILHRAVYGAFDPGPPPSLLIADAASLPVATLLQETFTAAARAQGAPLIVHDLVPLPPTDPAGATASAATLSLIIAGVLGATILYTVTRGRALAVHLSAVIALGIGAGLLTAVATNVVVGAFTGQFLAIWGVAALFVLALALPIAFFHRLLGLPGSGVGLLVFIVGDPSSGGATAPQLLPGPWRAIGQALPPGAAVTAMRDVVYFHGYGATRALIVLGSYAALGAILAIIAGRIRAGAPAATSGAPAATSGGPRR